MSATFTNLTRSGEIGPNSYLIDFGDARIVIDSGMDPKAEGLQSLPRHEDLPENSVDAILVSHSHLDHVGSLPLLQERQSKAEVIMSPLTASLADAMLHNSVNVMTSKREELGLTEYPFFTHNEVEDHVARWKTVRTRQRFRIANAKAHCQFYDAGHIPGSVGMLIEHNGHRLFYTGDVHFENQTVSQAADFPRDKVDTLILETTRGAAPRRPDYTREQEVERLVATICATIERGGSVLIPIFALGKSQELLITLHDCREKGLLPDIPIQIGGLGVKMTTIIDKFASRSHRHWKGFQILRDMDLVVAKRGSRKPIVPRPGHIFALSSGMMTENTTSSAFAREFIDNPKNSVIFVGYADPASPAGHILAAKPGDPITLNQEWDPVPLHAQVERFDFSGHATREELLAYAVDLQPRKVFLVHGDAPAVAWFEYELALALPECDVLTPLPGKPQPLWNHQ